MNRTWMMVDQAFAEAWAVCSKFTMTSPERGYALWKAVEHVARDKRPGALVECGCWRGGSAMLMMLAARHFGIPDRPVVLFDTFSGMTDPREFDVDLHNRPAAELMEVSRGRREQDLIWAYATLDQVKENLASAGLDTSAVTFVEGDVSATVPPSRTGTIALLRLDTDFYESTKVELECLYPRLCPGGILLIDDYGHWQGAQRAVDDYFDPDRFAHRRPLLTAVDYTGRMGIKPPGATNVGTVKYDHVPDGFEDPNLIAAFPTLVQTDAQRVNWPWLRKNSPHLWRTDTRSKRPLIGVLSYEEALILYNMAKPFAGKPALEIGCHFAWSTAHLVAAGLHLDVVDPALGDDFQFRAVSDSIEAACGPEGRERVRLHPGFSPGIIPAIAGNSQDSWSVAFIDGLHDGEAPLRDTQAVLSYMADDALILLHDLLCPDVFAALQYLRSEGWRTQVLNTSQVMGIAWRGDVTPPDYFPDPMMPLSELQHLRTPFG